MTGPTGDPPEYVSRVVRAFVRDGRLASIPAQDRKRQVIFRYLVERCFEAGRTYTEREVNELLGGFHEDVATLRRGLVVAGLMTRAGGEYRRAG